MDSEDEAGSGERTAKRGTGRRGTRDEEGRGTRRDEGRGGTRDEESTAARELYAPGPPSVA